MNDEVKEHSSEWVITVNNDAVGETRWRIRDISALKINFFKIKCELNIIYHELLAEYYFESFLHIFRQDFDIWVREVQVGNHKEDVLVKVPKINKILEINK